MEGDAPKRETVRYRLEVGGQVDPGWAGWFEADTLTPVGENTVLELLVADQTELYGRLRRIHDLNLRLISVTLVGPEDRIHDIKEPLILNSREDTP